MKFGLHIGEFLAPNTQIFLNAGILINFTMNLLIVLNVNLL